MRIFSAAFLLIAPTIGLLTACSEAPSAATSSSATALMANDFESSAGWGGGAQPSLTTAQAHSGRTAVLASPEVPFSYTFARTLAELSPGKLPLKMELTGWVWRTAAGSAARLVVQVEASPTDQKSIYYTALPVAEAVSQFGQWAAVKVPVTLPVSAAGTNLLKVYLWNDTATSPTYLDDVALRVVGQ